LAFTPAVPAQEPVNISGRQVRALLERREPMALETSAPGVFEAGDIRAGAMNRVASAVGEGSMVVPFVHETWR
jgi:thioredoxin reductase